MKIEKLGDENIKLTEEEQKIMESLSQISTWKNHSLYPIRIDGKLYVVADIGFGDFGAMVKCFSAMEKEHDACYWKVFIKYLEKAKDYQARMNSKKSPDSKDYNTKDINVNNFVITDLDPADIDDYYKDLSTIPHESLENEFTQYKLEHFLVYPEDAVKKIKDGGAINFGIAIELTKYIEEVSNVNSANFEQQDQYE